MLLIQWYHEQDWVDFRGEEFTQLLAMEGVALEVRPACNSMLLCVSTPIDLAVIKAVCSRAVLVKAVYQLEAKADGVSELASAMEALSAERVVDSTSSWALNVECINRSELLYLTPMQCTNTSVYIQIYGSRGQGGVPRAV
jgi:hypothetical protein